MQKYTKEKIYILYLLFFFKIPTIKIKNPFGITVSIWENVHTELGLVHLEYQLSQQTSEVLLLTFTSLILKITIIF